MPKVCVAEEKKQDFPESAFEVKMSTVGDGSGRGVFTKVDIPKGSSIDRRNSIRPVIVPPSATNKVFTYMDMSKAITDVWKYFDGYGWQTSTYVSVFYVNAWHKDAYYIFVVLTQFHFCIAGRSNVLGRVHGHDLCQPWLRWNVQHR